MVRFHPVPFYFTVPGTSIRGQLSNPLTSVGRIAEIYMIFPAGTSLNLLYQFFLLGLTPANLTVLPGGGEMTQREVLAGIFVGDAITYSIPFQYDIPTATPYLSMFATNNTASTLSAQAIAIVEDF